MSLPLSVYTLGAIGSFSSQGSEAFLSSACPDSIKFNLHFCSSFPQIFESVKVDPGAIGIIPIQNESTSSIHENVDMFFQNPEFSILAEFFLPIRLHILGLPGTKMKDITHLYSHPKAFEQCRGFIDSFRGEIHYGKSTSSLAKQIKKDGEKSVAVLGGTPLVQQGFCVLQSDVQDYDINETQFVVFGMKENSPTFFPKKNKWTIHFECQHKPGALVQILQLIAINGGNLLKIESRPIRNQRDGFRFWIDIDTTNATSSLCEKIKISTLNFQSIGQYESGKILDIESPKYHLSSLRQQIDSVDMDIINLLKNRQAIVQLIAEQKKKENISIEQPARFAEVLQSRNDQAIKQGISADFIQKLFTLIHKESISFQQNNNE
jgi:prephenate dehydratase/chorismate mutase